MTTATATPKKKKPAREQRPFPNGLGIEARFVHDDGQQVYVDNVNDSAADIGADLESLQTKLAELKATAADMTLRELAAAWAQFQSDLQPLRGRIREQVTKRQALLPDLLAGCRAAVLRAEQAYNSVID